MGRHEWHRGKSVAQPDSRRALRGFTQRGHQRDHDEPRAFPRHALPRVLHVTGGGGCRQKDASVDAAHRGKAVQVDIRLTLG